MTKLPLVLVILDGFAISNTENGNAPLLANMENLYAIHHNYPWTLLNASGKNAGLIDDAYATCQNSHEIIGSGRISPSYLSIINKSIENKSFFDNEILIKTINEAKKRNKKYVHVIGLISKSPIVGYKDDVFAICKLIADNNLVPVVHAITDGRDVNKKSCSSYLLELQNVLRMYNGLLADISGRFYALDVSNHWRRTIKAWNVMTNHDGDSFNTYNTYIEQQYENGVTDEFFYPQYNSQYSDETKILDDDILIVTPYRYTHELLSLVNNLYEENYDSYIHRKNIYLTLLTPSAKDIKSNIVFKLEQQKNTLGEIISKNKLRQLRVAENLRFNDITYHFDGLRDLDLDLEDKKNIASTNVATYDLNPDLAAIRITNYIIENLDNYDVIIANYANPDILGHTGNIEAAIKSMKIIDLCLGTLYEKVINDKKGSLIITSDHGNCEEMLDENDNNITYHSRNKVPFILCERKLHLKLNDDLSLRDIAPTILSYLGLEIPNEMTGQNLIKKTSWFTNFIDSFKKKEVNLEIKVLNDEEVNKVLNAINSKELINNSDSNKYVDENDFSALEP